MERWEQTVGELEEDVQSQQRQRKLAGQHDHCRGQVLRAFSYDNNPTLKACRGSMKGSLGSHRGVLRAQEEEEGPQLGGQMRGQSIEGPR